MRGRFNDIPTPKFDEHLMPEDVDMSGADALNEWLSEKALVHQLFSGHGDRRHRPRVKQYLYLFIFFDHIITHSSIGSLSCCGINNSRVFQPVVFAITVILFD